MRAFELSTAKPTTIRIVVEILCALVAMVSLWRYQFSVLTLLLVALAIVGVRGFLLVRDLKKSPVTLLVSKNGAFVVADNQKNYAATLVFALCSGNQMVIRARVMMNGRPVGQEWHLKRTSNEAQWRSSCQWVQWLGSQGETKKPQEL